MSQYSNTVSFQAPTDYGLEQQAVDRQRKLAEAMMMRSQQPQPAGQMVGGRYVPQSWTQGLAQALQGPAAMFQQKQADEKAKDISGRQRQAYAAELEKFGGLMSGTPARSFQTGANEMGDEAATQNVAAVPGDRRAALAMALGAQNPALQQVGMQQMLKGMDAKWEKAELPNADGSKRVGYINVNSQDPLSTFQSGGTAPVKLEGVNTGGSTAFVNPYAPKAEGAPTIAATGNPYKDLLVSGANGPAVNQPMLDAKKQIAQAGKSTTNVSVNTATKPFLTEIGKGAGEQVMNDYAGAKSAAGTLNNVQQIRAGLKNVIAGPGANARIKLSQVGEVLGVNGKDATEQLQNTRNVMQGLARQELSAAGQMKGQGQITESERGILRRAEAGDISELTVPEINTLLGALEKTSAYRVNQHNQNLSRLKKDPNAAGVAEYMTLPETPASGSGFRIIPE